MIVIDVGAQHHPPEESTYFLADWFHQPEKIYAFDIGRGFKGGVEQYKGTKIIRERIGAWVNDQGMAYTDNGMCSGIRNGGEEWIETFDLAEFIRNLGGDLILKLDCEGAEYVLLPHLVDKGVDKQISLLLIEWHPPHLANGWYVPREQRPALACEVTDWNDLTKLPTEAEPSDPPAA